VAEDDGRLHVAIIMDGNGRWARARGLPRTEGHREGCSAVRRVVEAAPELSITTLTLYAFSSDNWARPAGEVSALLDLLAGYLERERGCSAEYGIRLNVVGRRDRLPPRVVRAIERAEARTSRGTVLHLRIAIDYSARDAIVAAAALVAPVLADARCPRRAFLDALNRTIHSDPGTGEVDLLIRTGGEKRLSDFLLWECAYAELVFTDRPWPEFDAGDLRAAVDEYHRRSRRFGRLAHVAVRERGSRNL
jgi:undecaprenyl diphosphate synthase